MKLKTETLKLRPKDTKVNLPIEIHVGRDMSVCGLVSSLDIIWIILQSLQKVA